MRLEEFFREYPETAVAFSGGADSAYLLHAAKKYGRRVRAYYVKTAFQPQLALNDALRFAKYLGVELRIIEFHIDKQRTVCANGADRCYHCKKLMFSVIAATADADGFSVLLDGTNASDDAADRPGMRALAECNVLSPLRMCGLHKQEIRRLSEEAGLFIWDKPADACLATRIISGHEINRELLLRTERAEEYLKSLGFSNLRVRTDGENAIIQLREAQMPLLLRHREEIVERLGIDYGNVLLDLKPRGE